MLDELSAAGPVFQPSAFWEHFKDLHIEQLEREGFAQFKRTVNKDYFQFMQVDPRFDQFRGILGRWLRQPDLSVLSARLEGDLPGRSHGPVIDQGMRKSYALYVTELWKYARSIDRLGLLDRLDEPELGHPVAVAWKGRRLSEDLCNSVLEVNSMMQGLGWTPPSGRGVIELGGGYGRVAWAFLQAYPDVRYVSVDIPPALAIAERYLEQLYPDHRIFRFRRFTDFEEIREEWESAQLAFLTPNQLDLIPPQECELFVNISSLHEMRPDQIAHYIEVVRRHCAGHFYTKQWRRSINAHDDIVVRKEDYPVPAEWEVVFDRTPPVQKLFFEAMYRMPAAS
jgi:putative sugar O-methyltransferase